MHEQIQAVGRMQDYIESHLNDEITPAKLAMASYYSPWYSYRLFTKWLKMTPASYIRRLRLSKAALTLRDEKIKVIDLAYSMGYGSVDGFTRSFYREFGCNPKEYAANPVPVCIFIPYKPEDKQRKKEKAMEIKNIFICKIEKPKRKVIIKRGIKAEHYFDYCDEVGCDVWGVLSSIKSLDNEPVCMWLPPKYIKSGTSRYVQGAEVPLDYSGKIPDGYEVIELPSAKYLKFCGEPFAEEDYEQAITQVWDAIKKFRPETQGYEWDKDNPRIQLAPIGERGYIELVAVKSKTK